MGKKLESRITRPERTINRSSVKNEEVDSVEDAVYATSNKINELVNELCKTLAYSDIPDYPRVDLAIQVCENSFTKQAYDRLNSIFEYRKNRCYGADT